MGESIISGVGSLGDLVGSDKVRLAQGKSGRKCECCGATLSIYNTDKLCWPCDRAIAEWKNFPTRRLEIEANMAPHCLRYVTKKYVIKRKKNNSLGGGDVSSGSWARAAGRKTLERK